MLKSISGGTNALEKAINGEELSYDDGLDLMVNENLFLLEWLRTVFERRLREKILPLLHHITLITLTFVWPAVRYVPFIEKVMIGLVHSFYRTDQYESLE